MATTVEVKQCGCKQPVGTTGGADYQDKLYGNGQRVHTCVTTPKGTEKRCTCCGKKS